MPGSRHGSTVPHWSVVVLAVAVLLCVDGYAYYENSPLGVEALGVAITVVGLGLAFIALRRVLEAVGRRPDVFLYGQLWDGSDDGSPTDIEACITSSKSSVTTANCERKTGQRFRVPSGPRGQATTACARRPEGRDMPVIARRQHRRRARTRTVLRARRRGSAEHPVRAARQAAARPRESGNW